MARKWWKYLIDPTGFGEKVFNGWKKFFDGQPFLESFYGNKNSLSDVIDDYGDITNRINGDYASADYNDAIADENATDAFDRQKELMALEANYNSPVYKSNELGKAGLNPALASGVSNSVSGASAQMSSPNAGQGQLANVLGLVMQYGKLKQDIKESNSRILANEASANASNAAADEAKSRKTLIDKEVASFDEKFNLEKGLKSAQTNQLQQAEKNMKNWLTNGSITSISQLIGSIGILIGALKGFSSRASSEVLIPEVVDDGTLGNPIPDINEIPKRLTSGNVKGTKSYLFDMKNKQGVYTMDDGSEFVYGVDENGMPWSKTRPNPYNGNVADAENLMNEWIERMKPLFGE